MQRQYSTGFLHVGSTLPSHFCGAKSACKPFSFIMRAYASNESNGLSSPRDVY